MTVDFYSLRDRILEGGMLTQEDVFPLTQIDHARLPDLLAASNAVRNRFRGSAVDLCAIVNAKSGMCPEDCSYCAQSSKSSAQIAVYPLMNKETVLEKAREAKEAGVKRFSIVTSGRKAGAKELAAIASIIGAIRSMGLLPCATLGLLNKEELSLLKESGLERYHHNLETSARFFPEICSTHTYQDKVRTLGAAREAGLSVCSGGIFGMGETWRDRIDMALALRSLDIDSVPINFLIPIPGTPLSAQGLLHSFEALTIIGIYRLLLPAKEIRVCGGRVQVLGEFHPLVFMAGADSLLTGNYLTTTGRTYRDDLRLLVQYGLTKA